MSGKFIVANISKNGDSQRNLRDTGVSVFFCLVIFIYILSWPPSLLPMLKPEGPFATYLLYLHLLTLIGHAAISTPLKFNMVRSDTNKCSTHGPHTIHGTIVYVPTWTVASCGKRREIYTIYMDCKGPIVGLEFQRTPARTKSQFTRNITFTTLKYLFHHQSKKSISHKDTTRKPSMTMENQPFEDVSLIQKKWCSIAMLVFVGGA